MKYRKTTKIRQETAVSGAVALLRAPTLKITRLVGRVRHEYTLLLPDIFDRNRFHEGSFAIEFCTLSTSI